MRTQEYAPDDDIDVAAGEGVHYVMLHGGIGEVRRAQHRGPGNVLHGCVRAPGLAGRTAQAHATQSHTAQVDGHHHGPAPLQTAHALHRYLRPPPCQWVWLEEEASMNLTRVQWHGREGRTDNGR